MEATPNALVTGGSRGIGQAIVRRLVRDGYHVIFSYSRDNDAADQLCTETEGRAMGVRADAGDPDAIDRLYAAVDEHVADRHPVDSGEERPYLDVLVNNAGILGGRPITDETVNEFDRLIAVNVRGFLFTLQQALPRMVDGGRVIAVSSMSTAYATEGEASYAASKAAVQRIVSVAAKELGSRGLTVNAVAPGPTDTDLLRSALPTEALDATAAFTPLGRLGTPTDLASVVSFLAGPDSGWISGQTIGVNGGLA